MLPSRQSDRKNSVPDTVEVPTLCVVWGVTRSDHLTGKLCFSLTCQEREPEGSTCGPTDNVDDGSDTRITGDTYHGQRPDPDLQGHPEYVTDLGRKQALLDIVKSVKLRSNTHRKWCIGTTSIQSLVY